jgi:hypothetical protein
MNLLRFSTDFTRFSNLQILLEIQFCAKAPGKNWGLAMWSSGMAAGGSGQNSGEGLAGEGRGWVEDGRGLTTGRFGVEVGAGRGLTRGRTGSRRWWPPRAMLRRDRSFDRRARRRGRGLRESGRARVAWSRSPWLLGFAAVGSDGGHGRRAGAWLGARCRGAATPLWQHACLPATDGPTVTSLGVCAGLGRSARQGGREIDRWSKEWCAPGE